MKVKELFKKFVDWCRKDLTKARVTNDEQSYTWLAGSLDYDKELSVAEFQKFFDRKEQNSEYKTRFNEESPPAKQPYGFYQTEINLIYGFHKSFAMRNQTRLQAYRNDLSQKGQRTTNATLSAIGKFEHLKERSEEKI